MISILTAAGICLLFPTLLLYLAVRFTRDPPARAVPSGDLTRWRRPAAASG
jgi:hypothetical protein